MSRGARLLNPKGALLRFPRHPAQSVTPEKEPHCEKTFFAATAMPDPFFPFF